MALDYLLRSVFVVEMIRNALANAPSVVLPRSRTMVASSVISLLGTVILISPRIVHCVMRQITKDLTCAMDVVNTCRTDSLKLKVRLKRFIFFYYKALIIY